MIDFYSLTGISSAECLIPNFADHGQALQVVFDSKFGSEFLPPVDAVSEQAVCVGNTAFSVFRNLLGLGKSAKVVQNCIEYYINKSLICSSERKRAARIFNDAARKWKSSTRSGREELSVRAFAVELADSFDRDAQLNIRLVVRTRSLALAS